ncbi:ATP-dependent RNA helicase, putative [Trypanosoma cruzi marinkellei]|uniref:RNA helicase n=1 Tax=Trypanosoma cruzi marinkellei TaxID=85056 RepID=K2NMM3_TRYCR|nr:ATP-dependent RNA helicase, putative [Trypanosoma cruzi marinkellei]
MGDGNTANRVPRLFDGPTGDVNMAFTHKVRQLLLLSSSSCGTSSLPAAVRASPLYTAILCFAEAGKESRQQQQQQQQRSGSEAGKPSVGSAPVVPSSLARRGVVPRDPLLQRRMRKQQQQQQQQSSSSLLLPGTSNAAATNETAMDGYEPQAQQQQRQVSHWSRRPLQEMTSAGWDVFREQVGIFMEIVSRRVTGQPEQQQPRLSRYTADALRPIRCWEEARLPLTLGTIVSRRYTLPTPIQAQCVPLVMATAATPSDKIDVLGVAETGSGKTAAYLIPLFADILRRTPRLLGNETLISHGPLALVMVPTRELAEQVTREASEIIHGIPEIEMRRLIQEEYNNDTGNDNMAAQHNTLDEIRIVKVVGGEQMEAQYDELSKGAHVVVGTLGQLDALLQQRFLALGNTRLVVMDEADRMIEEHQRETLIAVLERCPLPRQTIMFTATLSAACEEVALKYFSPEGFIVVRVPHRCSTITQVFEMVPNDTGAMFPAPATVAARSEVSNHDTSQKQRSHPPQVERRRHPLLHPMKFARLVTYLAYATPPVVVFANEKRTCDVLYDELRAEANHLAALEESFSLEALVGESPPVLQGTSHDNNNNNKHRRRPVLNLGNMRSIALVHSEQSQAERRRLVELFRRGERRVLITTDLLSRGLDVPNVTLVINYDMPRVDTVGPSMAAASTTAGEEAVQKYIHRIGRTGRAGASGVAVSLLCLPSLLIQRAEQHTLRNADDRNHGGNAAEKPPTMQRIDMAGVSTKTRVQERDRQELTGAKNGKELDENLLKFTDTEDAMDNNEEEEDEEGDAPPRSRRRMERQQQRSGGGGSPPPSFPHDETLLQPLWAFIVSCAETNSSGGVRGAELIRQQRCRLVQMSPALAALMMAFTRSSPYGAITT